jgi:hypothetical protein
MDPQHCVKDRKMNIYWMELPHLDRVGICVLRSRVVSTTENNKEFSLVTTTL